MYLISVGLFVKENKLNNKSGENKIYAKITTFMGCHSTPSFDSFAEKASVTWYLFVVAGQIYYTYPKYW